MSDWIDDFFDDRCTLIQISIIESLLSTSSIGFEYENLDYETLDYETAEIIISHLKENDNPRDCREQWKKFTKQL
jgi:hypothetical protein